MTVVSFGCIFFDFIPFIFLVWADASEFLGILGEQKMEAHFFFILGSVLLRNSFAQKEFEK